MGQAVLVDAVIRDGGQLLRRLHEAGGGYTGALWYQQPDTGDWRLLIEVPSLTATGPLAAYTLVDELLMSSRPPLSLRLADVTLVASIAGQIAEESTRPPALLGSAAAEGILTDHAFIYSLHELRTRRPAEPAVSHARSGTIPGTS